MHSVAIETIAQELSDASCIIIYAKYTGLLLGGERAFKGTLDVPLPKQMGPNGFGPNDLDEAASMVDKPTLRKTSPPWT